MTARSTAGARCGAWARMSASSRRSSGPGSTPSSVTRTWRASRSAASASPCRPARYRAVASSRQASSRSGWLARCAGRSAAASSGRPTARSASARRSTASIRSSSIRLISATAQDSLAQSAYAGPRQSPSADSSAARAGAGRPAASSRPASPTAASNCPASTASGAAFSAYPGGSVTRIRGGCRGGLSGSRARRRSATKVRIAPTAPSGATSHRSSTRRSTGTTRPWAINSRPSTRRCRCPRRGTGPRSVAAITGPSTPKVTATGAVSCLVMAPI
ncbi:putative serine-rich protein [Micromonospora noduli]|nr:putative serine-rich protein [Micromonospora noduli]